MTTDSIAISTLADHIQRCSVLVNDREAISQLFECAAALRRRAIEVAEDEKRRCHHEPTGVG
jgi:hypothetical protein